ncbi:MAG: benzoate-CoA ligase family protein [Acidobacteria bacterium]|nr:benzoate-CoA ligase family protein [Acidobacteriota bacterium]
MSFQPPEIFNIADYFLDQRVREGRGDRIALRLDDRHLTYREVQILANRFGGVLRDLGVRPEERVLLLLEDGPEFVGAFFGVLKIGAVVVMVNPALEPESLAGLIDYSRASCAVVSGASLPGFAAAAERASHAIRILTVGAKDGSHTGFETASEEVDDRLETFRSHRDDAAIWLFSGGTTGLPKGVVQSQTSFANTTELYAKNTLGYSPDDVTLSVPKLFFGYATGSNLLFPFAVGASTVLFPEHPTAELLFDLIERHRPSILINVPTMINQMVSHPDAATRDLSCLRFATSAGEALPVPLYHRWQELFGVELLDGLGTAEMWHVFVTNRPGDVKPGTLGRVVDGFEIEVRDDDANEVAPGEPGKMWVRGDSLAIGYWRDSRRNHEAFRGEWFVGGDLISRDADGYVTYCGRGDDMLKVGGKWLAPQEVESCLMRHPAVKECAVVGVETADGLTKPCAFVVAVEAAEEGLEDVLKRHVLDHLDAYRHPRRVLIVEDLPRTHLGKVDRRELKRLATAE